MARGRSAGAIWVDIIADSAKFVKALNDSRSRIRRFARQVKRTSREIARSFRNIGLAAAGIGTSLGVAIKSMTSYSSSLVEASRSTGMAIKQLEGLRMLFEGDGVAIERTDKALQAFNNRLGQAARGFGQGKRALEDLGVSIRDSQGNVRATSDVFAEVAEKVASMGSESEATSALFDLLGNDAKILAPIIRKYGADLDSAAKHANRMNTITEKQHNQNKELDQTIKNLGNNITDTYRKVLSEYAPQINDMLDRFDRWVTSMKDTTSMDSFISKLKEVADLFAQIAGALKGAQIGASIFGPKGGLVGAAIGWGLGKFAPGMIKSSVIEAISGQSLGARLQELQDRRTTLEGSEMYGHSATGLPEYQRVLNEIATLNKVIERRNIYQRKRMRDLDYVRYPKPGDPYKDMTWQQEFIAKGGVPNVWTPHRYRREILEGRALTASRARESTLLNPRARRDRGNLLDYRNPFFYPGDQLGGMNPSLTSHYSHVSAMVDLLGATRARSRPSGRGIYFGADARRAINAILGTGFEGSRRPMDDNSPYARWSNRRRVPIGGLSPMVDNPPLSMQWFARRGRGRDPMKQATELARMLKGIQSIGSGMTSSGPGLSAERFADFVLTTVVDDAQEFIARLLEKRRGLWKETGITEGSHLVSMERLMRALPMDDDSPFSINRIVNMAGRAFAGRMYAGTTDWQNMSNQYPDQSHLRGRIYGPDTDWQRMSDNLKRAKEMQKEMEDFKSITQEAHGAFTSFGDSLIDIAMSGKESWLAFREVIKGLGRDLVNIGLRRLVTNPIANSLFGTEDEPGGFFGGAFDWLSGGSGAAAKSSSIDFAGIGSSASIGGGGRGVTIINNIKSTDGPGVRAALAKATPGIINAAQSQISDNASRFGTTRQMIRGTA